MSYYNSEELIELENKVTALEEELQAKADLLALVVVEKTGLVEENAELRKMLKRNKKAFLNQIELDLIRDSAKQETKELADSIHKLLNK